MKFIKLNLELKVPSSSLNTLERAALESGFEDLKKDIARSAPIGGSAIVTCEEVDEPDSTIP